MIPSNVDKAEKQFREILLADLAKIKPSIIQGNYKAAAKRLEALYAELTEKLEDQETGKYPE